MPNCIIYARKSTKRDNDPRYQEKSLSHQVIDMKETAERHGLEIVEVLEESESAFFWKKARPVFAELLKKCEKWKIDYIVFDTYNRVARNMTDAEKVQMLLHNGKLKGVFIGKEKILYTPSDMKKFDISVWIAKQETQDKSDIVKRRMPMHAKEGRVMSKAPFGYRNVTEKNGRKTVEVSPKESELMVGAFNMRIGGSSYEEVSYYFEKHGVIKRPWVIQKMMQNQFYTGMMKFAGEYYQWSYDPIISPSVFKRANGLWRALTGKKNSVEVLLKGMVICEETGKPLIGSVSRGKYAYYHEHRDSLNGRKARRVSQDEVFRAFEEVFERFRIPDEFKEGMRSAFYDFCRKKMSEVGGDRRIINQKLATIEVEKKNLMKMRISEEISSDEFKEMKNDYALEEAELVATLKKLSSVDEKIMEKFDDLVQLSETLCTSYKSLKDSQKALVIKLTTVQLFIDPDNRLHIKQKEPFQALFSENFSFGDPTESRTPVYWMKTSCPNR